jgi:DNA-binding PadR family transcriptional regulator
MSLRHALLGLLAEQPASGWDLSRRFDDVLGAVWPAGHPQIYGELRRLEQDGFIEIESEGPRRRKAYRITDLGLTEVRRWLRDVEVDHTLRLEALLRSVFFWLMTPDQLSGHLRREASYYETVAASYRELAEAKDRGDFGSGPQTQSLRIAAEAGARLNTALGAWATWALDRPITQPELNHPEPAEASDQPKPGDHR